MGNQQLALSPLDLAYIAGIIDGEGSISAHRNGNKKGLWYTPRLSVYNTDSDLIYWIRDCFQACGAGVYINEHLREHGRKKQYVLQVHRLKSLLLILPLIIPFLKQKKQRAEWLLEFCQRRVGAKPGTLYQERELELVALLFEANGDKRNNAQTVREAAHRLKRQSAP